ncbi:hypothetical protein UCDDA912_g08638 [Diaporthe ampelina]|uniref:Uncharacterized protein n=1 Tax=Diaporthe ampelina TaxID=1214573 RepID=A0A0G2F9U8_9PEZI|nr:hypothetical protein UCDDA912_g08638 [Diaporthe ampelina]
MDSGLTIEDLLDEQDVLSLDDVVKNIHGLNPQRQIVSAREFKSLFNTLLSGFTILQLEKYVVWHREQPVLEMIKNEVFGENESLSEESTIPEDVVPKRREYAWMTEQAHWTPYVDGAVEEAQYPLAGYVMKSMPPKQRLVVQLMRECWEISVQELLDGNGHVDIRVRDLEFKLLTRKYNNVIYYQYPVAQLIMNVPVGTQRWLERISRLFLKEGQQIQVRRSSNLVRITAPKPVAETCVHELGETLQKIKTETLKLDQVPKQRLDAGILEELGRITNSVVQFGPGREAFKVEPTKEDLALPTSTYQTFAPLIPPVAELDLPGWGPYDGTKNRASTILMRFVPYSEDAGSTIYTERAPPLELRLSGDADKVTAIHSLRAMNRTSISDILLPAEQVDIRTTQCEYAEFPSATIDSTEGMEPLCEFINKSHLEPSKGRLVTPPRLHNLGLPRWLLLPPLNIAAASTNARAKAKKKKKKAASQPAQHLPYTPEGNEIRKVSYVFAGLEQHHAVETTYDGWKLVYTSIEAGQHGGRRAELRLEAVPGYDVDLRRAKEAISATFFLRSIYQLATGQPGHLVQRAGGEEQVRTTISWVR